MKQLIRTKHVTIQAATAEDFDERVNAILALPNLADHKLTYRGDGFCVCIEYTTEEMIYENIKEEYEARGDVYYCDECPYLKPIEDRRHKYHECKCGTTSPSRRACLLFYQELARGDLEVQR